ncbi:MAG: tetratricopeptide repeat protein [Acaryochloris sp. CRU_2_0]|nr:tetratricopeptide repeat protein [Acaryochloris sp. CRU_2_0]
MKDRYRLLKPLRPIDGPIPQDVEVFECVDTTGGDGVEPGTHLIIKILLAHDRLDSYDAKRVKLMYRESEVVKNVDHPGIPKAPKDGLFYLRDTGVANEVYCLVQQKIEGQTLDKWLEEHGPISEKLALNWLDQLAESLHAVHQLGYFHRDIKPANVMIKPDGKLMLIDFGAARDITDTYLARISSAPLEDDYNHRLETTSIFTVGYASPEQMIGKGLPQSDFFALGRTFVHLLTGIRPNHLPTNMDTGELIWRDKAKVSKPLADFLDTLMAIAPGKRPQNTASLLSYLQSSLPRKLRAYKLRRDRRFQFGVVIGVILLLIGGHRTGMNWASTHYFDEGSKHLFADRYKEARADLERAIQFNPKNLDAYNNLASTCQSLNDDDCAFRSYKKVLELDPNNWVTYSQLGGYYDFRNENEQAAKYYRKAIEVGEDRAVEAYNNLARIEILQGNYAEAIRLSTKAINISEKVIQKTKQPPEVPAAGYKNRGWAKLELQQYDQAIADLNKSSELGYMNADTYCLLTRAYEIKKDDVQADSNQEICLTSAYTSPEVYEWKMSIIRRFRRDQKKLPESQN